jgi:glycosyltransferase involved in cell wall biosynthesis
MILYITKLEKGNIGADMHYKALCDIFGRENIFFINLSPTEKECRLQNYISYGKYKSVLDRVHRWMQGNMMFISNDIISEICELINSNAIKTVFIEDSVFGNLVKKIKKSCKECRVFSFYHDVKADLYKQWMDNERTLKSKIEYTIGIKQENINQKYADIIIVFNERDAKKFQAYYGKRPDVIIPLPAPVPAISDNIMDSITAKDDKKHILFVGKKYYPNLVGFKWFVDNVLPSLTDNIQVDVVGRGLEELRNGYSDPRINVIGGVESLNPYYENADIVIAPLFDGGGMKSKTVEALSFGKIFVGTEESLFGFWEEMDSDIRGKTCYQCNTPEEWIQTINNLANDDIHKFNEGVFELFKAKFSYDVIRDQLKAIMEE